MKSWGDISLSSEGGREPGWQLGLGQLGAELPAVGVMEKASQGDWGGGLPELGERTRDKWKEWVGNESRAVSRHAGDLAVC